MQKISAVGFAALLSLAACAGTGSKDGPKDMRPSDLGRVGDIAGDAAAAGGDLARAADLYTRSYQSQPSAEIAVKAIDAARRSGNAKEAAALARDALAKFPRDARLREEAARTEATSGATPTAASTSADTWTGRNARGISLAYGGNYAGARAEFTRARTMATTPSQVNASDANLALVKSEMGDLRGATEDMEAVARRPGAAMEIQADLAMLYGFSRDREALRRQAKVAFPDPARAESVTRWLESGRP